jgi:hypothetical protein
MFISERHEPLLPFPKLAETATDAAGRSTRNLALRPFGLYESDLNVDFQRTLRPFLVTRILECCTRDAVQHEEERQLDPQFFWNLTVGKRTECLLNLIALAEGSELPLTFRCHSQTCGQSLEIEISVAEICALQDEAYAAEQVSVQLENNSLVLRRPTGSDQLAWLKSRFADEESAIRAMLRTLLPEQSAVPLEGGPLSRELVQTIESALEEQDPLVNFSLTAVCPYCEEENLYEIDLEELSLSRLRRAQLRLLASVHKLAAHYHWSEQQIFSVPFWRRAHYLSLIEKEKNQ